MATIWRAVIDEYTCARCKALDGLPVDDMSVAAVVELQHDCENMDTEMKCRCTVVQEDP